jgi:hypothetical protein
MVSFRSTGNKNSYPVNNELKLVKYFKRQMKYLVYLKKPALIDQFLFKVKSVTDAKVLRIPFLYFTAG